jgi:DNA-binding CsgD family transcriptional regulator
LRKALDLAERMGAEPLARRAREELDLAGGRPRSPWSSGVEALTPGELRVARMAASGMTNREVAEALFVTPKAVGWHLGNTYRKLGVNDRTKLGPLLGNGEKTP